jgi:tripartite-type tricarboxylate transporter receptor subunit TctC
MRETEGDGPSALGKAAGVELAHVAYKGGPLLVTDMVGGHIPAGVGTPTDFGELHRAGKLRILAIGGLGRSPALADVATFRELGYDIDGMTWQGMHAPAGTPKPAVDRLAAATAAAVRTPEIQDAFIKLGLDATGTTAEQFVRIMEKDKARWEPIVRASGFKED